MNFIEDSCDDACIDNEPLFLDDLFKDECDHINEKTCIENIKSRVLFEKRKLDLNIFIFNEPTNDQSCEDISQEPLIDQNFEISLKMNLCV